ncbi:MAG: argininosuccinate lyase [Phycisphaerae bacterium]|nr:argininosuccinate lyase [Phycisphaerae bacterium]
MPLWSGRFSEASDPLFKRFNDSLRFDHRLLKQDIQGSIAWAAAIERAGVLESHERERIVIALAEIEKRWGGDSARIVESGAEDVHSFVEAELIRHPGVGDLGKKLHTGRSRNDQVATDLRLWVRDELDSRLAELRAAQAALLALAEREIETIIPGYTHLQRAQPILLSHWALAYFEMLDRDASRLADARRRANLCPLGSGALAGSAYPIDRAALARDLGFDAPTANSLDAVSDRDFVVESLAAAALCAVHLSRLAEDLILYTSGEFAFVELSERVTSGSSLMPQKKNPDALELIRGKVGRILGAHTALCTTIKGLPLAYNKDLQADKAPLFDAMDNLSRCLRVLPVVLEGMKIDRARCLAAAKGGYSNATDLADYLVSKGVPFREAHELAGKAVRLGLSRGQALEDLPLADLQKIDPRIQQDVFARIALEAGMAKRNLMGGTGTEAVRAALARAKGAEASSVGRKSGA